MAKYYFEYTVSYEETDNLHTVVEANSLYEAKRKLKSDVKEEYFPMFKKINIDVAHRTSDDARAD